LFANNICLQPRCISDTAPVCKTEGRAADQFQWHGEVPGNPQETGVYRRSRYRGSDAPLQSTVDTSHYLEIADSPSSHQVQAEVTPIRGDQESTSADHEYENLELRYEDLDANTLVNRGSLPERPVYEGLAH